MVYYVCVCVPLHMYACVYVYICVCMCTHVCYSIVYPSDLKMPYYSGFWHFLFCSLLQRLPR